MCVCLYGFVCVFACVCPRTYRLKEPHSICGTWQALKIECRLHIGNIQL